jgi:hypothetical protein
MRSIRIVLAALCAISPVLADYYYITTISGDFNATITGNPPSHCTSANSGTGTWEVYCQGSGTTEGTGRQDVAEAIVSANACESPVITDVSADVGSDTHIYSEASFYSSISGYPAYDGGTDCDADLGCSNWNNGAPSDQAC